MDLVLLAIILVESFFLIINTSLKKQNARLLGKRGLILGFHKSCLLYEYIIFLNTYSLWNNKKCSIGNIYVPQRRHNLQVDCAKQEIISWLQLHSSNPSILLGDFNLSTEKLNEFIDPFKNWMIFSLNGSNISWKRGDLQSDIDHALVNTIMMYLLSSGSFINFPPISDHKSLLIYGNSIPT